MRLFRWFFGFVITLIILIIIAIVVVPSLFDPNDYRDEISKLVKEKTQRDLAIEGDLNLSVFPWLGVSTGKLSLSQPNHLSSDFGAGNMLEVDAANIRLKVMPLLKSLTKETKDIQIDTIVLNKPNIELITLESGLSSLDGLSGDADNSEHAEQQDQKTAATAGAALIVQGVDIDSGRLVWEDRKANQRYELRELNVNTGNLLANQLAEFSASGEVLDSQSPDILQFDITGLAKIDAESLAANGEQINIQVERGDLQAELQLGAIDFTRNALLQLSKIAGNVTFSDEQVGPLNLDISVPDFSFDQSSQIMNLSSLSAQGDIQGHTTIVSGQGMQVGLQQQAAVLQGLIVDFDGISASLSNLQVTDFIEQPAFQAQVDVQAFDAQQFLNDFGINYQPENSSAMTSIALSSDVLGSLRSITLKDLNVGIDQSTLTGFVHVNDFSSPNIEMDLLLDSINLDNYVPKTSESDAIASGSSADARGINALFTLMPLFEQFQANGKVIINDLIASGLSIKDIVITAESDQETTMINPSAKLYDGSFDGSIRYERLDDGGRLQFAKTNIDSINLEGLLTDAQITDQLSGEGNLTIDMFVEQKGADKSSQGVIDIAVNDGAFKGVDIQKMLINLEKAYNQYKGRDYEDSGEISDETKFSSLTGTFNLENNVLSNDDFDMKAPLFRVSGEGIVDLDVEEVDYTTNISIVNSIKGQGGESLDKLKGVTLPVRFFGPLTSPQYKVDLKTLAKSLLEDKVNQEKEEYIQRKLGVEGGGEASTKDILKSLLNKEIEEKYGDPEQADTQIEQQQTESDEPIESQEQAPEVEKTPEQKQEEAKEEAKEALKNQLLNKLFGD